MSRTRIAAVLAAVLVSAGLSQAGPSAPAHAAAATTVQVYLSSESRTAGYEPKNGNWYTNPATGLAGTVRATAAPSALANPSPIDWNAWVKQKPDSSGTDRNMLG